MLEAYRAHVAERAALGIPPLPLSKQQTTELVALLKNPPKGEEEALVELITYRVPAGVDQAAGAEAQGADAAQNAVAFGLRRILVPVPDPPVRLVRQPHDGPAVVGHDVVREREVECWIHVGVDRRCTVSDGGVVIEGDVPAAINLEQSSCAAVLCGADILERVVANNDVVQFGRRIALRTSLAAAGNFASELRR